MDIHSASFSSFYWPIPDALSPLAALARCIGLRGHHGLILQWHGGIRPAQWSLQGKGQRREGSSLSTEALVWAELHFPEQATGPALKVIHSP